MGGGGGGGLGGLLERKGLFQIMSFAQMVIIINFP